MTQSVDLALLRAALAARESAPPDAPVRIHNRLMTAVLRQCALLAQTPEGRALLSSAAATDEDPRLRLVAATIIQDWDTSGARATLEDLVRHSGGTVVRPMTMTAALAVRGEPGRSAALCLLNLDYPKPAAFTEPEPSARVPVVAALLDSAERVYSLAMNGGLNHAYELVGEQFPAAAEGGDAVGAVDAAIALREAVSLLAGHKDDGTRRGRASTLAALSADDVQALQLVSDRFCSADDLLQRLEAVAEN